MRRALLRRIYQLNDLFAGTRDTPKYLIVLMNYAIRKRALIEGRRLTAGGASRCSRACVRPEV